MKCTLIMNKLKNKSSYGYDTISNKHIKYARNVLTKPLTLLINQCIHTGIYPDQLKLSRVKPLHKSGDKTQFGNYRPIALLPSLPKIFERVMFDFKNGLNYSEFKAKLKTWYGEDCLCNNCTYCRLMLL